MSRGLPSIQNLIHYNKKVGCDATAIFGMPGTGKSNMANRIVKECVIQRHENFVIPGDRFCEWANVAPFFDDIQIILPKDIKIHYKKVPDEYMEKMEEIDYEELEIMSYFKRGDRKKLIVVYDAHYRGDYMFKATELWSEILNQLLDRTIINYDTIGLLFHEGRRYFPSQLEGDMWSALKTFSNLMVDIRKGMVRFMVIAQDDTGMRSSIRRLCLWKIFRKGFVYDKIVPKLVRRQAPKLRMDQYILMFSGSYNLEGIVEKLPEHNEGMRMIPLTRVEDTEESKRNGNVIRNKLIRNLYEQGFSQNRIAELSGLSQQRISQLLAKK